jgi:hypothetical protein
MLLLFASPEDGFNLSWPFFRGDMLLHRALSKTTGTSTLKTIISNIIYMIGRTTLLLLRHWIPIYLYSSSSAAAPNMRTRVVYAELQCLHDRPTLDLML